MAKRHKGLKGRLKRGLKGGLKLAAKATGAGVLPGVPDISTVEGRKAGAALAANYFAGPEAAAFVADLTAKAPRLPRADGALGLPPSNENVPEDGWAPQRDMKGDPGDTGGKRRGRGNLPTWGKVAIGVGSVGLLGALVAAFSRRRKPATAAA